MRKRLLPGVCALLGLAILVALSFLRVKIPWGLSPFLLYFVLGPLLLIPITALNKKLLAWRKTRGRDIEEEEKYEIDGSDVISLRQQPNRPTPESFDERHPLSFR